MTYFDIKLPEPVVFENKFHGKVLIIGSGKSTAQILQLKEKIRNFFDVIIACNYAFREFDDIIDFHIVTEKTSNQNTCDIFKALNEKEYRKEVPRIINWKGSEFYNRKYNLFKVTRNNFNGAPNIKKYYKDKNSFGLFQGPVGTQGFSLGTVLLCAIHFSSIIGCNKIYTIGADLVFKDSFDHFYNDNFYRKPDRRIKKEHIHKIIDVNIENKIYQTTLYFKESADYMNNNVPRIFNGIDFFDFSDGLLNFGKKLNIKDCF